MKIQEMELLVRIAETGSMTLTAQQLHLTPAAVSATLRRVEDELGLRLFDRTTRSIHPTDDGVVVLEGCQDVVERWRRTLENARGESGELFGAVHLTAPADTTYQVIAPTVANLADDHPNLQVILHSSDTVQHLHRDAIDVAIRYGQLEDSSLSARKLAEWPGILVAAPNYLKKRPAPEEPEQLSQHRCISLQIASTAVSVWTLRGRDSVKKVSLQSPLCGDGYLARRWAVQGKGIAMKSLFDVIDDLETGQLVRVLDDYATDPMPIHAVFPSRRYLPARVRTIDTALAAEFGARSARCERFMGKRS